MKRFACRYAIVQFMPYPETGEFANIGVVLACPSTGFFDYQLQLKKSQRYTDFFRDLERKTFLRVTAALRDELERIKAIADHNSAPAALRHLFTGQIQPREAIIRFSEERACFVESPQQALQDFYTYYVDHDFVTAEYKEKTLERRIQQLLNGLKLQHPFRADRIGSDDFSVNFPLVQVIDNQPVKIIKPFYLGQDEPNKIYDHADRLLPKLKRLRDRQQLPDAGHILFTVEGPDNIDDNQSARIQAFEKTCEEIREYALIVSRTAQQKIVEFAAST